MRESLDDAVKFFHEHAGYSWRPDQETEEEGTAREMANTEALFPVWGFTFSWDIDEDDSVLEPDDNIHGDVICWVCTIFAWGKNIGSLGGVDLGHGDPRSEPYARVVQVYLAREHMS